MQTQPVVSTCASSTSPAATRCSTCQARIAAVFTRNLLILSDNAGAAPVSVKCAARNPPDAGGNPARWSRAADRQLQAILNDIRARFGDRDAGGPGCDF